MNWIKGKPDEDGFYWCYENVAGVKMVEVWSLLDPYDSRFFTNEQGNPDIRDEIYDDVIWYGPISPPSRPTIPQLNNYTRFAPRCINCTFYCIIHNPGSQTVDGYCNIDKQHPYPVDDDGLCDSHNMED